MEYLSEPKLIHYDTITIHRTEEKEEQEINWKYPSPELKFPNKEGHGCT